MSKDSVVLRLEVLPTKTVMMFKQEQRNLTSDD